MANDYRVLGQSLPVAATLTPLYTVGIGLKAIISSLVVCNASDEATTFRVSVAIDGAEDSPAQYLYRDIEVLGNDTFVATIGPTMSEGDELRVYAEAATLSFNLFGTEIS